jgi:2-methylcitrate dehydratase
VKNNVTAANATMSLFHCNQTKIDASKVTAIEADVIQLCYDFAGGGLYGVDKVIQTKEQADHSLPYLLAVALLDGDVMLAQFNADRIIKADVQRLLKKVSVRSPFPRRRPAFLDSAQRFAARIIWR